MPTLRLTNDQLLKLLAGEEVAESMDHLQDDGTGSVLTLRLWTPEEYLYAFGEDAVVAATNLTSPLHRFVEPDE